MNAVRPLIVIVEDDAGMCRALQRLLHVSGFDTLAFASAEDYAQAADGRVPHCFVIDVRLPGASGPQLFAQLAQPDQAHPPAVFITSHDNPATRHAVASAGGRELLIKPFWCESFWTRFPGSYYPARRLDEVCSAKRVGSPA